MNKAKTAPAAVPLTWKERVTALRNLPRFFRLVWQTSPGIMTANSLLIRLITDFDWRLGFHDFLMDGVLK